MDRDEGPTLVVRGELDGVDRPPLGHFRRGDVLPGGAVVPGQVDQAVVAPGPKKTRPVRRFFKREDGSVDFDTGVVAGDGLARITLFALIVAGQIRADDLPRRPFVGRSVNKIRAVIEHRRVVRRDPDRGVPLEAITQIRCLLTDRHLRPRHDLLLKTQAAVESVDGAAVAAAVSDVGVRGDPPPRSRSRTPRVRTSRCGRWRRSNCGSGWRPPSCPADRCRASRATDRRR